jgi:Ca2+-dependent lipid-binding protein
VVCFPFLFLSYLLFLTLAFTALTLRLSTLLNEDKFNKGEFDCFRDVICPIPGFFFQKLLDEQKGIDDSIKKGKIQTIRLEILKITGTNLAPKDRNGFSDPFIQAHWEQIPVVVEDAWEEGKKKHKQKPRKGDLSSLLWKSEVKKRTLNPSWDFRDHPVGFDMHAPFSSNFTLLLQVWDADLITKDFLGSVRLAFGKSLSLFPLLQLFTKSFLSSFLSS